jgi:hypothetical protein
LPSEIAQIVVGYAFIPVYTIVWNNKTETLTSADKWQLLISYVQKVRRYCNKKICYCGLWYECRQLIQNGIYDLPSIFEYFIPKYLWDNYIDFQVSHEDCTSHSINIDEIYKLYNMCMPKNMSSV